jgi:hypothetical protein
VPAEPWDGLHVATVGVRGLEPPVAVLAAVLDEEHFAAGGEKDSEQK